MAKKIGVYEITGLNERTGMPFYLTLEGYNSKEVKQRVENMGYWVEGMTAHRIFDGNYDEYRAMSCQTFR